MTVKELIEKLQGLPPETLVLLFGTDPDGDGNDEGWFPLHHIEVDPAMVFDGEREWTWHPSGQPAIWLWTDEGGNQCSVTD